MAQLSEIAQMAIINCVPHYGNFQCLSKTRICQAIVGSELSQIFLEGYFGVSPSGAFGGLSRASRHIEGWQCELGRLCSLLNCFQSTPMRFISGVL